MWMETEEFSDMDETGPETERGEASLAAASPEDEHPPSKPTKAMKQAQRRKQRAVSKDGKPVPTFGKRATKPPANSSCKSFTTIGKRADEL